MAGKDLTDPEMVTGAPEIVASKVRDGTDFALASRIMKITGLLLVGGVIVLFIGPKIAPLLPSGMAPVAAWLAPGGAETKAEIAALQAAIAGLPKPVLQGRIEVIASRTVSQAVEDLSLQIATLQSALDDMPKPVSQGRIELIAARKAEQAVDVLRDEIFTMLVQLSATTQGEGEVAAETAAGLSTLSAANARLKTELAALGQRIDEVSAVAEQVVEVKAGAAVAIVASNISNILDALRKALSTGIPFTSALVELESAGVEVMPTALTTTSDGIATMAELRTDFPDAAHKAIRASIIASAGDGFFASIGAVTKAQLAVRSLTPQTGVGPDAVLSRAEEALKQDNLAAALAEINTLPQSAVEPEAMAAWLDDATTRLAAIQAYQALYNSLNTQ
ncbi:MAG: mitofilin family membrane protein [Paracoccaceae bacterium]